MSAVRCNKWFLCSLVAAIFAFLKRILFSRFRRRRKSESDLPTIANISTPAQPPASNISAQDEDAADWDDWDYAGAPTSIVIEPTDPNNVPNSAQMGIPMSPPGDEAPEMDYFSDMAPTLKRTVLIRKKDRSRAGLPNSGMSNRLAMSIDNTPVASSELSTWDEGGGGTWEDETGEMDLTWDANRVIKEKKQAERDKRAAEQHRKKVEREAQRATKKESSKLAVKLK